VLPEAEKNGHKSLFDYWDSEEHRREMKEVFWRTLRSLGRGPEEEDQCAPRFKPKAELGRFGLPVLAPGGTTEERLAWASFLGMMNTNGRGVRIGNYALVRAPRKAKAADKAKAAKEGDQDRWDKVGVPPQAIAEWLLFATGGWPSRVGSLLFSVDGLEVKWLENANQLFAWISGRQTQPVRWAGGEDKTSREVFDSYLRQTVGAYEAVEALPHYPSMPRRLYLHPPVEGGDGGALRGLLNRFNPATPLDRDLLLAAFLTPFWGGPSGSRPGFLIGAANDDGRGGHGTGKTTVATMVGHLAGGLLAHAQGEDFGRLVTRLLSPDALTVRVGLLDNLKSLKFSSANLEALLTAPTVNGHRMYCGDASRPNTLTWFVTQNGGSLSKDMAQRLVPVMLRRPDYSGSWEEDTLAFITRNRWAIVGDILHFLEVKKKELTRFTRWGPWERDVLACVGDPEGCQKLIAERQASIDGDQEESDLVREAFVLALRAAGHDPDTATVFIPSARAAEIVNEATGEQRPTQRASAYLLTLTIPELWKSNATDGGRGWRWTGKDAPPGQTAEPFFKGRQAGGGGH
jgi:hypothetical protein